MNLSEFCRLMGSEPRQAALAALLAHGNKASARQLANAMGRTPEAVQYVMRQLVAAGVCGCSVGPWPTSADPQPRPGRPGQFYSVRPEWLAWMAQAEALMPGVPTGGAHAQEEERVPQADRPQDN